MTVQIIIDPHADTDPWLPAPQAARLAGLARDVLYLRVKRGQVPHQRRGERIYIRRSVALAQPPLRPLRRAPWEAAP